MIDIQSRNPFLITCFPSFTVEFQSEHTKPFQRE